MLFLWDQQVLAIYALNLILPNPLFSWFSCRSTFFTHLYRKTISQAIWIHQIKFLVKNKFIMLLYSSSDSQLQYRSSKLYHVLFFHQRPWALKELVQVEMWCRGTVSYSAAFQPSTGWASHSGISTRQLDSAHYTESSKAEWLNRIPRQCLFPKNY